MPATTHASCRSEFTGDELLIANDHIERRWKVKDGALYPSSLLHVRSKTQWISSPSKTPTTAPVNAPIQVTTADRPLSVVNRQDVLITTLPRHRFQIFADAPSITVDADAERVDSFELASLHLKLIAVTFVDKTDHH